MAKLSHIEDVEKRREQEAAQVAARAAEAEIASEKQTVSEPQPTAQPSRTASEMEADFHGIDADEKMGSGQRFLIILAVLVTLAAVLYIVNSWLHFI